MRLASSRTSLRTLRRISVVAVLFLLTAGPLAAQRAIPIIVDSDAAADDLVALLYVLGSPEVRVLGITTVNGVASPAAGAQNILRLLDATGQGELPVVVGEEKPLADGHAFPRAWREDAEKLEGIALPPKSLRPPLERAPEWIRQKLDASQEKISILALGPLTNLALVFGDFPQLCQKVDRIVWLGGVAFAPGNVNSPPAGKSGRVPRREWNAYVDPEAVRRVFASGCRIEMVGLDAVYDIPLRASWVEAVGKGSSSKAAHIAVELLRKLLASPWHDGRSYAADAVAAIALTHPALVRERALELRVITQGSHAGETAAVRGSRRPNAVVALHLDASGAEKLLLDRLKGAVRAGKQP